MSLIPYYLRHLRRLGTPQHLSAARHINEDLFAPFARDPFFRDPFKYVQQALGQLEQEAAAAVEAESALAQSQVKIDGKKVEVQLDVRNFSPEQIKVKTIGDEILVEGEHEVKRGDGWTRSHFERRFVLPEGFPPERVECHLDAGKLRLVAFRADPLPEREVPVQHHSTAQQDSTATHAKADAADTAAAAKNA